MSHPHYDIISREYASARQRSQANARYYDFLSQYLLDLAPDGIEGAIYLDCMCGSCELARVASSQVAQMHATDISMGILRQAQAGNYIRACADSHRLPYPSNTFDLVLISGGLHHVRKTFKQVLKEAYRVLKPNGWLILAEPADDNPIIWLMRETLHRLSPLYEKGERGFRRTELETALSQAGFADASVYPFGFLGYL